MLSSTSRQTLSVCKGFCHVIFQLTSRFTFRFNLFFSRTGACGAKIIATKTCRIFYYLKLYKQNSDFWSEGPTMVRRFGQKYSRIGIPVENLAKVFENQNSCRELNKYTKFSKFYNRVRFYKYAGFYKHVKLFQVREISQLFQIYNYVSL